MSQENVEIVRAALGAFDRRDVDQLGELSDPHVELVSVFMAVDAGDARYLGPRTWASYFTRMDETWDRWGLEDVQIHDAEGDAIAVLYRFVGKGKVSQVPVERRGGLACWLRGGKLWRLHSYLDPADVLKAVGLSE